MTLDDDEIFQCPFVFMSDVGTVGFDADEIERLRTYLLKGGFLYVDDFWGERPGSTGSRSCARCSPST